MNLIDDERTHEAFDRSLQPAKASRLPSITLRRLLFMYRTVYTTAVCLVASYSYNWGGISTYLSPVLSAVTAALYLGDLLPRVVKVAYGSATGAGLGVMIGFAYKMPAVLVPMLFLAVIFVNRCSAWDQTAKVFGGLTLVLTTLWPIVTDGVLVGRVAFRNAMAIVGVPFCFTILTLIFPVPALAIEGARAKSMLLCRELSSIVTVLVRGFIVQDFHDLYSADFDVLHRDAEEGATALATLLASAEYEVAFFPFEEDRVAKMKAFHKMLVSLLLDLEALKDILKRIQNNHTQAKYVETLAYPLEDMAAELTISLRIICEELSSAHTAESYLLSTPNRLRSKMMEFMKDEPEVVIPDRRRSSTLIAAILWAPSDVLIARRLAEIERRKNLNDSCEGDDCPSPEYVASSKEGNTELSSPAPEETGAVDVVGVLDRLEMQPLPSLPVPEDSDHIPEPSGYKWKAFWRVYADDLRAATLQRQTAFADAVKRLKDSQKELLDAYMDTRRDFVWMRPEGYRSNSNADIAALLEAEEQTLSHRHKNRKASNMSIEEFKILVDENHSMRNLNPRGAYLHRLNEIASMTEAMGSIFTTKAQNPWPLPFKLYLQDTAKYVYSYIYTSIETPVVSCWVVASRIVAIFMWFVNRMSVNTRYFTSLNPTESHADINHVVASAYAARPPLILESDKIFWNQMFAVYVQPVKIASAIVIASLLVVVRTLRDNQQNGLWAVIVITLIRQDATSSSFLVGYQRIEGTVMGAVYAFTAYQALNCGASGGTCPERQTVPVLLAWLAFCAYFREGPRHGYASIVAGFTPIVLFIGPVSGTTEGAWLRVQKTFIGVAVYLIIDNFVFPNRTDSAIRADVVKSLDEALGMFNHVIRAVRLLVDIGKDGAPCDSVKARFVHKLATRRSLTQNIGLSEKSGEDEKGEKFRFSVAAMDDHDVDSDGTDVDVFETSRLYLDAANGHIEALQVIMTRQINNLKIVIHDPELWQRPFPLAAYNTLIESFKRLLRSGRAVSRGAASFQRVLEQMALQRENVWQQLHFYEFMSKRIFAVVSRTDTALRMTSKALHRLYEHNDMRTDLTPLITLSHYFDKLIGEIDIHFKNLFITSEAPPLDLNPWFLLAWQNIFEALCDLVRHLSALGKSLHNVRSIEAINAS